MALELKASRELDRLVSIRLFRHDPRLISIDKPFYVDRQTWHWHTEWAEGRIQVAPIPCYSTDLKAAWEVLDRVAEEIGNVTIEYSDCNGNGKAAIVRIVGWLGDDLQHIATADADTAPLAICQAALLAVARLAEQGDPQWT